MTLENNTVVFIGHKNCYGLNEDELKSTIIELINLGVTEFLSGGMGEFDRKSARIVYELKQIYPHIKNILVIPYFHFNIFDSKLFDEIVYPAGIEKVPYKFAIIKRNQYMVDNSTYAICFVDHSFGGASKTLEYAKKKNVRIINLAEKE